uniref:Uncharacterized protein n=1 Tax=Oryza punctata TaxID=4537 RepID=A0A0E0LR70_ORYPU
MKPCKRSKEITELVRKYVGDGLTNYIKEAESYRRFNDNMGQWALERAGCSERLGWSLEKPFDESKEGYFIHDAWLLAQQLVGLGDNKKI